MSGQLGEMFRLLHAMNGEVGKIHGKLDSALEQQERLDAENKLVEARVRKLENKDHREAGAFGAIGAIVGTAMTVAAAYFTGHIPLPHK